MILKLNPIRDKNLIVSLLNKKYGKEKRMFNVQYIDETWERESTHVYSYKFLLKNRTVFIKVNHISERWLRRHVCYLLCRILQYYGVQNFIVTYHDWWKMTDKFYIKNFRITNHEDITSEWEFHPD